MRKLNILKSILDFLWIVSMPIIIIILIFIPALFFVDDLKGIPFAINGQDLLAIDFISKIILSLVMISYLILLYCLFLFRKVLRFFQQLKLFDVFVHTTMNKIGLLLIISAFLSGVPSFLYSIIYNNKFEIDLSFSPFILTLSLGLFFMVLSEVFKIAKTAKEENELTI